jgi:hypothetical protein
VDAAAYVRERQLGLAATFRLVATLDAPFEEVAPRAGDLAAGIEPIDAARCRITIEADTLEWLAFRLIRLGCGFAIEEPPELIAYIRALAERLEAAGRA